MSNGTSVLAGLCVPIRGTLVAISSSRNSFIAMSGQQEADKDEVFRTIVACQDCTLICHYGPYLVKAINIELCVSSQNDFFMSANVITTI